MSVLRNPLLKTLLFPAPLQSWKYSASTSYPCPLSSSLRFCHTKGLSGIATEILFTLVKAARCGITVAVCVKAMKQLVFYVSSPPQTAGWLLGAVSSYSTRGPSLYYNGVRQAEQFQPSCKRRNETKSGYSDTVANKKNFSGPA